MPKRPAMIRMRMGWRPWLRGRINPLRGAWYVVAWFLIQLDLPRAPVGMLPPWWIDVAFSVRHAPEVHDEPSRGPSTPRAG